jgi:hypothetical protein
MTFDFISQGVAVCACYPGVALMFLWVWSMWREDCKHN